jgi:hypothetical protein
MDIDDEYIRDYSFEPEFITRKDSLVMHRSRLERTRKHNKIFKRKCKSLDNIDRACSVEALNLSITQNIIEAEVDAFQSVTINIMFLRV